MNFEGIGVVSLAVRRCLNDRIGNFFQLIYGHAAGVD